jgi:hypothetical protein
MTLHEHFKDGGVHYRGKDTNKDTPERRNGMIDREEDNGEI